MARQQDYWYSYRGELVEREQFLADTRRFPDAKLNMVLGGSEDGAVYVFDSDDELLEWAKAMPVADLVEESLRNIAHVRQRQGDARAEESLQRDVRRRVEQAHQLAREAALDLSRRADQMRFLKMIGEEVSASGDPALAWEHPNFEGEVLPITGGIPNLAWMRDIIGKDWNNIISSFTVGSGYLIFSDLPFWQGSKLHGWPYRVEDDLTKVVTPSGVLWNDLISSVAGR